MLNDTEAVSGESADHDKAVLDQLYEGAGLDASECVALNGIGLDSIDDLDTPSMWNARPLKCRDPPHQSGFDFRAADPGWHVVLFEHGRRRSVCKECGGRQQHLSAWAAA